MGGKWAAAKPTEKLSNFAEVVVGWQEEEYAEAKSSTAIVIVEEKHSRRYHVDAGRVPQLDESLDQPISAVLISLSQCPVDC